MLYEFSLTGLIVLISISAFGGAFVSYIAGSAHTTSNNLLMRTIDNLRTAIKLMQKKNKQLYNDKITAEEERNDLLKLIK
jgi:hypothetical protein